MNSATAARLAAINREFYDRFGASFSSTRRRIQPGIRRVLERLQGHESILDLGCGNGQFARELARRHHRGPYLGLDLSLPMLREAQRGTFPFSAHFQQADIQELSMVAVQLSLNHPWTLITAFAVLHHIPSLHLRLNLLKSIHELLDADGRLTHSNWQFLNSERLRARIRPWESVSISPSDVDAGDHLLDWRGGGSGLRYVHQFSEAELADLADRVGFRMIDSFYSDGDGGRLGLYQVWQPA